VVGALKRTAEALTKHESEWKYPEDALEDALLTLTVTLIVTIIDKIEDEKRKLIPTALRKDVLERDQHRYAVRGCSYEGSLALDHHKPVSEGGKNTAGNLVALCPSYQHMTHAEIIWSPEPRSVPV
jgi:hypothetical protein